MFLEGIKLIGEAELQRKPLVEALVNTRLLERLQGDQGFIVELDIYFDPPRINVDFQELNIGKLEEVLWVGNAAGSNSPQDRLTTDNPTYLVSQTVPNLLNALPDGDLKALLQRAKDVVYLDLGGKKEIFPEGGGDQQYERYRWVWDLRKLGLDEHLLSFLTKKEREDADAICSQEGVEFLSRRFLQAYARKKGKAAEAIKLIGKVLKALVAHQINIKSSQIKLYTLTLNGERLVRHPDYAKYIEHKLVNEVFEGSEFTEGVCHLCGSRGQVTANTTRFKLLKFYNTDMPGFSSGLRDRKKGGFLRNYTLCEGCYRALLAGERFVENKLHTSLGRSNVYVIPTFHAPEAYPTAETIEEWAKYLKDRLTASATLKGWQRFQGELERYQRYEERKALFVLNLLFATKGQAAVKIDKLIADVPPSRLDRLDKVRNTVRDWTYELLGEETHNEWDLGLGKLFYLLPLRQRARQVETRPYLELLDALLEGRPVSASTLIAQLVETACVHHFERYEAHVQDRPRLQGKEAPRQAVDRALVLHMLQSQLLLRYLKELGLLRGLGGERPMAETVAEVEQSMVDEALRAWMDGLGLHGARRGLFLLGVLIGKIGSTKEQHQSGKPILNKLHFQGMDQHKLIRLANEVYEKLRQYKDNKGKALAESNDGLYAAMKAHLDRSLEELGSPQENVYWVLSGYSYATWQAIRHARGTHLPEGNGSEEQTEEEVAQ